LCGTANNLCQCTSICSQENPLLNLPNFAGKGLVKGYFAEEFKVKLWKVVEMQDRVHDKNETRDGNCYTSISPFN
jgi:hypothetical protein